MKTIQSSRILQESSSFTSYQFGIRSEDLSHIFSVLRNQMYSDKILAVIREYSTNAYDAHVDAGIKDTPIRVTLPNNIFPEFKVRDFGRGLSEQDIQRVYAFYGCSTKRDSNDTVGQLGFGSKSAFAYGDNFVITSYHGGLKTVYNAVIDTSQIGKISKLYQEPMKSDDTTGVEITIPIKSSDFRTFESKARQFYAFWDVMPELPGFDSSTFKPNHTVVLSKGDWKIVSYGRYSTTESRLFAIMGNVTYPINVKVVREKFNDENVALVERFINQNTNMLLIRFNIGDLEISSSRESLQYSDHTYNNILSKLNNVIDHIKTAICEEFEKCSTLWDAMVLYNDYFDTYGSKFYGLNHGTDKLNVVWKKIPIMSNRFPNIKFWCNNNGKLDPVKFNALGSRTTNNYSGILTVASARNNGWRLRHPSFYSQHNIVATNNSIVVLNDIPHVSLLNKCINKVVSKTGKNIRTVYILKFTKSGMYNEFVTDNKFETVPVYKLSDVFDEVKAENKRVRKAASEFSSVKTVSFGNNRNRDYYRDPWIDTEVDLRNSGGYYVDIEFNVPQYENRGFSVEDVNVVTNHLNKCFDAKIDTTSNGVLYGLNKKNRISRGFKSNKNNWINVFELAAQKVNETRKIEEYKKYVAYLKILSDTNNLCIPIQASGQIYDQLDNKNTEFALFLKELNEHLSLKNFTNAWFLENKLSVPTNKTIDDDVSKYYNHYHNILDNAKTTYTMLSHLTFIRKWLSSTYIVEESKIVADYINLVDKATSVK